VLATVTEPPQENSPRWLSAIPVGSQKEESFRGDECVRIGHVNDVNGKVFSIKLRNETKPLFCRVTKQPALVFPDQTERFDDITIDTYKPPPSLKFEPATDAIWPKEWPERVEELRDQMQKAEDSVDGYIFHVYQRWEAELKWRLGLDKPFDPFDL
jgi:hypothetical protein